MNYRDYVQSFHGLYLSARGAKEPQLPELLDATREKLKRILILAPHPDDECLMAGLAIRAKREWGTEVYVLPFSYGSSPDRQAERKRELSHALDSLQFTLIDPRAPHFQELESAGILEALQSIKPDALILPHDRDGHGTHIRCALAGKRAAEAYVQQSKSSLTLFESEYWMAMEKPDCLVPLSSEDLIQMGEALLQHKGEVSRNPFHLSLPAFAMEQMRRGSEAVSGMGSKPRDFVFAQLYRKIKVS